MAKKIDYDAQITAIKEKIVKKQSSIKALKSQLNSLKEKKTADDYKALTEYMVANNLSAKDVLEYIKA